MLLLARCFDIKYAFTHVTNKQDVSNVPKMVVIIPESPTQNHDHPEVLVKGVFVRGGEL